MTDTLLEINDCWNRIGVWSSATDRCHVLQDVIHCQNCNVYSNAGRTLLNRPYTDEFINEWSRIYQQKKDIEEKYDHSVIVFRVGDEWYGLSTGLFREVAEMRQIHSIPHRRNRVLRGIVNLRGELEICVSLGNLFHLSKGTKKTEKGKISYERLIMIEKNHERYVFPVSEVAGIQHFNHNHVNRAPSTINMGESNFIKGIIRYENRDIGLIDDEILIHTLARVIK